ncbi:MULTISPECIES: hypothetical protein [unclassified Paraburkholderia]|uniref:hypothetical protein n=1 Tax=unclassified Paraburkholderia TaxID=2615204 RepID=UPI002AAF2530|nr:MULTISPECIES: hypothetical protein [unclassified Paraburkholderia]
MRKIGIAAVLSFISLALPAACFADAATKPATHVISSIDLAKPFGTHSPWQFIASQAAGGLQSGGIRDTDPGTVFPCITADNARTCLPDTRGALRESDSDSTDGFAEPHFLLDARVVHASTASTDRALLVLKLGSIQADDGDQRRGTQVYAYDRARDSFAVVYAHRNGNNNNQEVRFIADGRLQGDIISVEPTQDAPFGYWVSVNSIGAAGSYKEVLRYRSATAYGDGNPLAVIDAEMPNIQRRMGLWKPGMPLPAPHDCTAPHLVKSVLWCG